MVCLPMYCAIIDRIDNCIVITHEDDRTAREGMPPLCECIKDSVGFFPVDVLRAVPPG